MIHPYASETYARSLSHWGNAFAVPEWGTYILLREIPLGGMDAFGAYPIAALGPDVDLYGGLERLQKLGLVAVTLVLDDFHRPSLEELRRCFGIVKPFKTHYIRRNSGPFAYGKHHRYDVRRAIRSCTTGPFKLAEYLLDWKTLCATLGRRQSLSDVHRFPTSHYAALATMKNVIAIGACYQKVNSTLRSCLLRRLTALLLSIDVQCSL